MRINKGIRDAAYKALGKYLKAWGRRWQVDRGVAGTVPITPLEVRDTKLAPLTREQVEGLYFQRLVSEAMRKGIIDDKGNVIYNI